MSRRERPGRSGPSGSEGPGPGSDTASDTGPDAGRPGPRAGARYFVRDAAPADLHAVMAMKAASWREAYGGLRDEGFFAVAEASLNRQVEHWRRHLAAGHALWLAEDARGRCVGMAAAGPSRADAGDGLPDTELYAMYVLAAAQGSGVADALLERAVGEGPCHLRVLAGNGRARAFYARHGFTAEGTQEPLDGPWAGLDEQSMVRRGA